MFRNLQLSIKYKLIMIIMTACVFSLVTVTGALLIVDRITVKADMFDKFTALAKIIADQSTAALSFKDIDAAKEILNSLHQTSDIKLACIYTSDSFPFAIYRTDPGLLCEDVYQTGFIKNEYLNVSAPVRLDNETIGHVLIKVSLNQINDKLFQMILMSLIIVLVIGVFTFLIAHRQQGIISEPILKLANTANQISEKGNYDIRLVNYSRDEIGMLYDAFNDMMAQIKQREAARNLEAALRKESEAQVRMLLSSTAEAIYGVDRDGKCIFVNPSCLKMLGYSSDEDLLGHSMYTKVHNFKGTGHEVLSDDDKIQQVIISGKGLHSDDEQIWRQDGTKFHAEYWVYPIKENEMVVGAVVTFIDITIRKHVEEELRVYQEHLEELVDYRTVELQNAYKELEAFSYSVSHDLRAPLRAIDGFSQALIEDYQSSLDEEGKDYLLRVRFAAQRMAQLIDDLLTLSRAMRTEIVRENIDLSKEVTETMTQLTESEPQRKVEYEVQDGLNVNGDATLVRIAVQNLLGNAWKYTSKKNIAKIKFGATRNANQTVYYVEDNGAGFDMKFVGKLFNAFQRLHLPEEFPGNGIGLATVQRVIRRHGGNIWAESEIAKGAKFYFTIPPGN